VKIEQIYTGCLSQGTYYITCCDEAIVIDPLREVQSYIDRAERDGVKIKYIFETHFHADFVSGHLTLSEKTGAPIVYGPNANPKFEAIIAKDGQVFEFGKVSLTAIHTPGHTMESTTYLLKDKQGKEHAIFTGDTLFIGDVGRPDLAQKSDSLTMEDLAGTLFDSLRNKIMPLPDDVIVYPAHGAGSACGKHMSKETQDTLGGQKETNYALRSDMTKDEFIKEVTDGLLAPPAYFPLNVQLNREGYSHIDDVLQGGTAALSPAAFEAAVNETGAIVLDVRHQNEFKKSHIPNSIFIGLNGGFAPWVGAVIKDVKQPIALVVDEGKEEEAVTRLARVGFDNTIGYLQGGVEAWQQSNRELDELTDISAESLYENFEDIKDGIYDVRNQGEFETSHIKDAHFTPLGELNDYMTSYQQDKVAYIHCAGGYRSVIAASILKARGFQVVDVIGGYGQIKNTAIPKGSGVKTV